VDNVDFYTKMLDDLPNQFRGKGRIDGLIYALSRQMNAVRDMYSDLNFMRSLWTAIGRQLDGIGEIAVLSREEATVLALRSEGFTHMTDDIYRLYLIQKIMANMTNCTYQDIYDAMVILWGRTPIWYSESIDEPATITMTVPAMPSTDEFSTFLGFWEIRPAGVQLHFTATAHERININADFRPSAFIITHIKTGTRPQRAVSLQFEGIIVDAELSRSTFSVTHEQTRETLHTGTRPTRILFLDEGGVAIDSALNNSTFIREHDRAGTKPRDAVNIEMQGIVIDGQGAASRFTVEHDQTSENLHTGTKPSSILIIDSMSANVYQNVDKEVFDIEFVRSGTEPQPAVLGSSDSAGITTGLSPVSFSVVFRKCGTGVTKS